MIRHYASLAAVLVALALVAAPARVVAAEDVRTAGTTSEPARAAGSVRTAVGNDPAISASCFVAEIAPSNADGGSNSDSSTLPQEAPSPDVPDEPEPPASPQPEPTPTAELPSDEVPATPSVEPSPPGQTPAPTSAGSVAPESPSPMPLSPTPSFSGTSSASGGTFDSYPDDPDEPYAEGDDVEHTASATSDVVAAKDSPTRTIGGLLAFTGAGAALILAALTLLALGLLMLWRSRVEEQSLFRAPDY